LEFLVRLAALQINIDAHSFSPLAAGVVRAHRLAVLPLLRRYPPVVGTAISPPPGAHHVAGLASLHAYADSSDESDWRLLRNFKVVLAPTKFSLSGRIWLGIEPSSPDEIRLRNHPWPVFWLGWLLARQALLMLTQFLLLWPSSRLLNQIRCWRHPQQPVVFSALDLRHRCSPDVGLLLWRQVIDYGG